MVSACVTLVRIIQYLRRHVYREPLTDSSHSDAPAGADAAKEPRGGEVMRKAARKRKIMDTASGTSVGGDGQHGGKARGSKSPRLNGNDHQRQRSPSRPASLQFLGEVAKQTSHVCTVQLQDWNRTGPQQIQSSASKTEFRFVCELGDIWQEKPKQTWCRQKVITGDHVTDRTLSSLEIQGYVVQEEIEEGKSASVLLAYSHCRAKQVAIKLLIPNRREGRVKLAPALQAETPPDEVLIHNSLKHPSIVEMYDYNTLNGTVSLVLEYCENGSLDQILQKKPGGFLTEPIARRYFHQMLSAVEYIHQQNIAHRDIKCQNFLINSQDQIKLCDFGVAKAFSPGSRLLVGKTGSSGYHAPEALKGLRCDPFKIDVWSLGIVLFIMLTSRFPYGRGRLDGVTFGSDITIAKSSSRMRLARKRSSHSRFQTSQTGNSKAKEETVPPLDGAGFPSRNDSSEALPSDPWAEEVGEDLVGPWTSEVESVEVTAATQSLREGDGPQIEAMHRGPDFAAVRSVKLTGPAKEVLVGMLQSKPADRFTINRIMHTDWYKKEDRVAFIGNSYLVKEPRKLLEGKKEKELKKSWDV